MITKIKRAELLSKQIDKDFEALEMLTMRNILYKERFFF